jgi:hypothetical protein
MTVCTSAAAASAEGYFTCLLIICVPTLTADRLSGGDKGAHTCTLLATCSLATSARKEPPRDSLRLSAASCAAATATGGKGISPAATGPVGDCCATCARKCHPLLQQLTLMGDPRLRVGSRCPCCLLHQHQHDKHGDMYLHAKPIREMKESRK